MEEVKSCKKRLSERQDEKMDWERTRLQKGEAAIDENNQHEEREGSIHITRPSHIT